jgi:hypothetical protein
MIAEAGDAVGGFAAGLLGIGIILGIIFVVVVWILFPIMVWVKLNELLESQRAIHRALPAANTVRDEIAKALQWMVNNWRDDSKPPPSG